jgi:foldase protein PrsA
VAKDSRKSPQLVISAIVATALIGSLAAAGSYMWANQNAYAAKVNGEVVERAKKQYAGQMGMDFNSDQGRGMLEGLKKNIMDSLVDMTLMKQKAREMNLSVSEDEYSSRYKEFLKSRYQGNEQSLEEDLKKNRITKVEFEKQFRDQILLQELYQKIIADIKITDKDIEDFYAKNKDKFASPEKISAKHILIKAEEGKAADVKKAKAKADDILKQVQGGASFEELAKKHSEDEGSKVKDGELGEFGKGQMVPQFEEAAWKLKEGEVTAAPIQTRFGWHIIKRGKTSPAQQKKLDEVKPMIKSQLSQSKEKEAFEAWLKKSKDGSKIDVNQEMLKVPVVAAASGSPGAPGAATGKDPKQPEAPKPADDGHQH